VLPPIAIYEYTPSLNAPAREPRAGASRGARLRCRKALAGYWSQHVWVTSIPEPPVSSGYLYTAWSLMRAPAKSYEITEAAPRLGAAPKSAGKSGSAATRARMRPGSRGAASAAAVRP
jgi:hypothetical protein